MSINWFGTAIVAALMLGPSLLVRLSLKRDQRREQAKARHPARGTRSLEDGLEWLLILEALAPDEMAEGSR